jgi:FtsP/CotA-like multicopper oxidase with cupredoxin domain
MPNNRTKQLITLVLLVIGIALVFYVPAANRHKPGSINQLPGAGQSAFEKVDNGEKYQLEAKLVKKVINGQEVKMLAYNGSIPGPTIEVEQGSTITVDFTNNTDIATTIHPHGVRVANANDGVPDVTQKLVGVGESYTYELTFPDAGVYWYHPHFREDYAQELGLYGNFIVVPKDKDYWSQVNGEQVVFLDDILLGKNGPSFDKDVADHTLMGRFGNTMLVNGQTDYRFQLEAGTVERFYFTNSANTRPFNVQIPGAAMKLVGGDNGKYERETYVDSVLLGPSERAIVEVYFPQAGAYPLLHKTPEKSYKLASIQVTTKSVSPSFVQAFKTLRTNKDVIASIDSFRQDFNRTPDKVLRLTLDMQRMMGGSMHQMHGGMNMMDSEMMMPTDAHGIEWEDQMASMNENSTTKTLTWKLVDASTGAANMDINNWNFNVGDRVKVRIINDAQSMHPMQHPIHFHGQRFLVLSRDGQKEENMVWKDTVFIPAGQSVDVLIEMSNPGTWMAHCHIAEHLEAGMMLQYKVD